MANRSLSVGAALPLLVALLVLAACGGAPPVSLDTVVPGYADEVSMEVLTLAPGQLFVGPKGACADTLLFVRRGKVTVTGPGGDHKLGVGGSARFGPPSAYTITGEGEAIFATAPASSCSANFIQVNAGIGDEHRFANGKLRVHILFEGSVGESLPGSLALLDGDADFAVPTHTHEGSTETLYILSGSGTMKVGEQELGIDPGVIVHVPKGVPHSLEPTGDSPLKAVQVYGPSGPEQRFKTRPD